MFGHDIHGLLLVFFIIFLPKRILGSAIEMRRRQDRAEQRAAAA